MNGFRYNRRLPSFIMKLWSFSEPKAKRRNDINITRCLSPKTDVTTIVIRTSDSNDSMRSFQNYGTANNKQ